MEDFALCQKDKPVPRQTAGLFFVALVRPRGYDPLARSILTPWDWLCRIYLNWPRLPMLGAFFIAAAANPVTDVTLPHGDTR